MASNYPVFEQLEGKVLLAAVPIDYRADTPDKILGLSAYDSVSVSGISEEVAGPAIYEGDGDVNAGSKFWFLDRTDKQPIGFIVNQEGNYDVFLFGDDPDTGIKEGIVGGNLVDICYVGLDNKFFEAHFDSAFSFNPNYPGSFPIGIDVTNNQIVSENLVPEPNTLGLIALGAGAAMGLSGYTRRKE